MMGRATQALAYDPKIHSKDVLTHISHTAIMAARKVKAKKVNMPTKKERINEWF